VVGARRAVPLRINFSAFFTTDGPRSKGVSNGKKDASPVRPYVFSDFGDDETQSAETQVLEDDGFVAGHPCKSPRLKLSKLAGKKIAKTIVEQAKEEAASMLEQAKEEANSIKTKALEEGLASGREQGLKHLTQAAESVEALAGELAAYKSSLYEEARAQVVELAIGIVSKIIGPMAESDKRVVVEVVKKGLRIISDRETLTLRVNPDNLQSMIAAKSELQENFDGIQKLTVLEDPSVKPGGCIIQTPTAEIDARLETQLQALVRDVRNA